MNMKAGTEFRTNWTNHECAINDCTNLANDALTAPDGTFWYCSGHIEMGQAEYSRRWPSHGPRRCQAYQCGNRKEDVSDFCTDHWIQVNLAYRCGHSGAIAVAPEKATIPNQNEARRVARQFDCGECTIV